MKKHNPVVDTQKTLGQLAIQRNGKQETKALKYIQNMHKTLYKKNTNKQNIYRNQLSKISNFRSRVIIEKIGTSTPKIIVLKR